MPVLLFKGTPGFEGLERPRLPFDLVLLEGGSDASHGATSEEIPGVQPIALFAVVVLTGRVQEKASTVLGASAAAGDPDPHCHSTP